VLLLLVLVAGVGGCEALSFMAQAVAKNTDAIYKIEDRPTLVLVDDPTNQLGDPTLEGMIASQVGFELVQAKAVTKVIPIERVSELTVRYGPDYNTTPIDKIGRDLGAAQVIAVYIESAEANADEEAYRPKLSARVRLIDAAAGKRIFPAADAGTAGDDLTATRGYPVNVKLFYRTTANGRGDTPIVLRKLTEKAGTRIAWLFYKHEERQPGTKFED
jgi:hypothetical protein